MTPSPLPISPAPPMPIQPELSGYGNTGNPVLDEISAAHASLSPQAQQAIEGAHGMLGISPAHSDPALAASTAPSPVSVSGVSVPESPKAPFRTLGLIAGGPDQAMGMLAEDQHHRSSGPVSVPTPLSVAPAAAGSGPGTDTATAPPPVEIAAPRSGTAGMAAPPPLSPHQAEFNRLTAPPLPGSDPHAHTAIDTGRPGAEQIHNPWLRGLATVGNVVASGLFPNFGQFIPGTSGYHNRLVANETGALGEEEASAKSAADVAHAGSQSGLENAQAGEIPGETALRASQAKEADARAETLLHPPEKEADPEKDAYHFYTSPAGGSLNPAGAYEKILELKGGKKDNPETQAYNSLLKKGKSPEDAYAAVKQLGQAEKPDTGAQDDQKYEASLSKQLQGKALTPEEKADMAAYKSRKTLGQQTTNVFAGQREEEKEAAAKANMPGAVEGVNPKFLQHVVTGYEKISNDYQNAQSANDDIQTALAEAKKGNKLAYAYEPTLGVLTINTAAGVKRVNMPEILSYAGAGSLGDKIVGFFQKQTSGASIPDNVLRDMGEFHQALANNTVKKYNAKIDILNKTYGANYPHETAIGSGSQGDAGVSGGTVTVQLPDGRSAPIHASQKDKFLKDNPGSKVIPNAAK